MDSSALERKWNRRPLGHAAAGRALGYTTQTIDRHARGAGTTYAEHIATRQ
jgi:hypothetical protein